ncbi:MAG: ethanolamine utilization protein EutH [Bacillota bacterium]|nr:ethanolamine utilization protein EutH [Bacillota bacterium]
MASVFCRINYIMNAVIAFLLVFSAIGLIDKILGNRFRFGEEFDKGMELMGPMALALVGIYCIGVFAAEANADAIAGFAAFLPFDASVIIGSLLAPDMGGLPVSLQIAETRALGMFAGMLLSTTVGVTVCFQLPVCLSGIREKSDIDIMMKGFIIGLAVIPPGIITGGFMLGLRFKELLLNFFPIIILCLILVLGFRISAKVTSGILTLFGNMVRVLSLVLFAVVIAGVYIPSLSLADYDLVADAFISVGKMAAVVCGSLVFSKIALKLFKKPFGIIAGLLKTNEYAVIGLILSLTTTFAMLPLFPKMDTRGKLINAAFSVGGAYILGGQMAFVSSMTTGWEITVFFVTKIIVGLCAVLAACVIKIDSEKNNAVIS